MGAPLFFVCKPPVPPTIPPPRTCHKHELPTFGNHVTKPW